LESPEVHTPHARHGGLPRWLELVIAFTALTTSISSIAIALHHGKIMEKLVEANSIPYLQGGFSNVTPEGAPVFSLDLLNRGVGPAHEQSLHVKVNGRYVKSLEEVIVAALGPDQAPEAQHALDLMKNGVRTRFIPGGQGQFVFRVFKTPQNARYWDRLNTSKWDIEYCYCSVFHECWEVREAWDEPAPVKECRRDETREFMP
jgi:hypothetical protein